MSGHSKWATIKRHKGALDAKRGKIFSVISKEITIAAKNGGGDPQFNPRLRTVLLKAKSSNMPNDNIDRAIKKGTGELPGVSYDELVYEGYGPAGIGIIVEVTTDNKNRSVSEVRSLFTKFGGNLAGAGALAFNFQRMGQFLISAENLTEDKLMEVTIDAGADDIINHGDHFELRCPLADYDNVSAALEKVKIEASESAVVYIPNSTMKIEDADMVKKILKLVDSLEDLEDVKAVHSNYDIATDLLEG